MLLPADEGASEGAEAGGPGGTEMVAVPEAGDSGGPGRTEIAAPIAAVPPASAPPVTLPPSPLPPARAVAPVPGGAVPGGAVPGGAVPGGAGGRPGKEPPGPGTADSPESARMGTGWSVLVAAAVLLVVAAIGVAAWLVFGGRGTTSAQRPAGNGAAVGGAPTSSSPGQAPGGTGQPPQTSSTPTTTSPAPSGLVTLAPGVAGDSRAPGVAAFVTRYFTAINNHDYPAYLALLNPVMQQHQTAQSFQSGFGSTTDSQIVVTGIASYGAGLTGVTMSFVSHQLPSQSATGTACTDWNITLFLRQYNGGYVLSTAPAGYRASYSAC